MPCGPLYTIDQTFADPQVAASRNGAAGAITRSSATSKVVGQAINMTRTPEPAELRPTPDLGQHTEEVLRELGYSDAAIADLRAREVV